MKFLRYQLKNANKDKDKERHFHAFWLLSSRSTEFGHRYSPDHCIHAWSIMRSLFMIWAQVNVGISSFLIWRKTGFAVQSATFTLLIKMWHHKHALPYLTFVRSKNYTQFLFFSLFCKRWAHQSGPFSFFGIHYLKPFT